MKSKLLLLLFFLILSLGIGELVIRKMGYSPDVPSDSPITQAFLSLNHKKYYNPDSLLGWRLIPGAYLLPVEVDQNTPVSHDSMGFRISSFNEIPVNDSTQKLFIFGCSFVYGCYMNDSETLAFRLQNNLKNMRVYDMAVPAYGNVQSLLSLQQQIDRGNIPGVVVLAYSSAHDERNYLDRRWEKQIGHEALSFRDGLVPYARVNSNGQLVIKHRKLNYHGIPLREHSALANLLDDYWNNIWLDHNKEHDASYAVIKEMDSICNKYRIKFIVAGISNDAETRVILKKCVEAGMNTVDLSVSVPVSFDERITPPNADIHLHYSDSLIQMINRTLSFK